MAELFCLAAGMAAGLYAGISTVLRYEKRFYQKGYDAAIKDMMMRKKENV